MIQMTKCQQDYLVIYSRVDFCLW